MKIAKYGDRTRVSVHNTLPTKTKQSFKDECNINTIMARFTSGSPIVHLNQGSPLYGDFTNAPQYQDAMNRVTQAAESFDALPSAIRDRFHNEPAELLAFLDDDDNQAEAVKLGLAEERTPSPEPEAAPPVSEAPPDVPAGPIPPGKPPQG